MFFHASFEAECPTRLYSNVPQRKCDRQENAAAVVRSIVVEGHEVIVSQGGRGPRGQDYYLSFEMENENAASIFLDRHRTIIYAMMQAGEGTLIPYEYQDEADNICCCDNECGESCPRCRK